MKTDRSARVRFGLLIACFYGVVGTLWVLAARFAASAVGPAFELPLILLMLAVTGAVGGRLYVRAVLQSEESVPEEDENAAGAGGDGQADAPPGSDSADEKLSGAVAALKRDIRRYETVLDNMVDGVVAVDSECCVTLFNRAAESIFRVRQSEVIGRALPELDLHPELSRAASECIASGRVVISEMRLAGLPERWIGIRSAPFAGLNGAGSAVVMLHDMSEVRRHEKNQKEFVSNVSHELKTPITSVRVTAEALLAGAKNDEALVDKFLGTIVAESDRLSALIEDLLDIARRDAGIIIIDRVEVDVGDLVAGVVALVRPQAQQNRVTINVDIPPGLSAYCDEMQVRQLVRNLLDNAIKYTPEDGVVDVRARSRAGALEISVKDTGIGIPQGEISRIFERFYRVDKARSRRLGGTGLGLSIVKDIVESHGGEITVETQLGKGSTFTVVLPGQGASPSRDERQQG